jgi:hypothetical protein
MLVLVEGKKREHSTPTPSPPLQFLRPSPPPPTPPMEGRGGGVLFAFLSFYILLTQPHMLREPHFLESFGVRAGGKLLPVLKGQSIKNESN